MRVRKDLPQILLDGRDVSLVPQCEDGVEADTAGRDELRGVHGGAGVIVVVFVCSWRKCRCDATIEVAIAFYTQVFGIFEVKEFP